MLRGEASSDPQLGDRAHRGASLAESQQGRVVRLRIGVGAGLRDDGDGDAASERAACRGLDTVAGEEARQPDDARGGVLDARAKVRFLPHVATVLRDGRFARLGLETRQESSAVSVRVRAEGVTRILREVAGGEHAHPGTVRDTTRLVGADGRRFSGLAREFEDPGLPVDLDEDGWVLVRRIRDAHASTLRAGVRSRSSTGCVAMTTQPAPLCGRLWSVWSHQTDHNRPNSWCPATTGGRRRTRTAPPEGGAEWCARGELNPHALSGTRT